MSVLVDLAAAAAASPGCEWWDAPCVIGDTVNAITETVQNTAMQGASDAFMNGWAQLEMYFLASWLVMPVLVDITAPDGTTIWLQQILGSATFGFAVLGGLITAGWTFLRLRSDKVKALGWRLAGLLLVSTSGAVIIAALDTGIRAASLGILSMVGVSATATITSSVVTNTAMAVSPGITLIIGIVAIAAVIIQWVIMIARGPLVVLLVGVWPFAAATASLGVQKAESAFDNISAWLIAFVIYPFPAALVYAAAFRLKGGADGLGGIIYGLVLEVFAVLLLPAIFRIIAPHTKAVGEKYGGKVAVDAAVSAAETAVTVGAAVVTAGAFAGAAMAKAGAAGAKAGASAASGAAYGSGSGGAAAPSNSAEPAGTKGAPTSMSETGSGADAVGSEQGAPPSGAHTVDDTPPGGGVTPSPAIDGSTPPDTPHTAGNSTPPATGSSTRPKAPPNPARGFTPPDVTPAHEAPPATTARAAAPRTPEPSGSGDGAAAASRRTARVQAATQAAQAASHGAGRAARKVVDDMDDIIGGQQ